MTRTRCGRVNDDPLYVACHDEEWGVPVRDDRGLYEMLVLEGAQAGLSWYTILKKREAYRRAFDGFDPERVARYDAKQTAALLEDPCIDPTPVCYIPAASPEPASRPAPRSTGRNEGGDRMKSILKGAAGALGVMLAATGAHAASCTNDVWNKVMERGKVVIGVKADYKPWGYRDEDGTLVGMEIDMAKAVADTMGVDFELVPVQSSNRMQFLEQGKVDMFIATMSDRADRRKIVGIPGPNYYTSGTNIMSPKALGFSNWEDLRGKKVCGKQGAFYNRIVEERYGVEIVAFTGNAEAKQALRDKKCVAWVYDDSSIGSDLASGNWPEFEMPLNSEDDNPWGLAVPVAEKQCIFGQFMSGMQYNWHRDGTLIELEAKWGIKPTRYLKDQAERFGDWMQ